MRLDLHTHSHYSDGTLSPGELVRRAHEKGVEWMVLTDHDSVSGYLEARKAAEGLELKVYCGVEINTRQDGVHILGYGIDWRSTEFQSRLEDFRGRRRKRVHAMIERLREANVDLQWSDVEAVSSHGDALGRPHIADALRRKGVVRTRQEAFSKYLTRGKPGFVEAMGPSVEEAIAAIRDAGGMAATAHPGTMFTLEDFKRWRDAGLEGVEAYYPTHSSPTVVGLLEIAKALGLLATGGSDFHGPGTGRNKIGGFDASAEALRCLEPRVCR